MITLNVKADIGRVSREIGLFGKNMERATASALNKAIAQGKTRMVKEIKAEYNLTATRIRQRLAIRRAYASGRVRLSAELKGTGKRAMNIIAFVKGTPKRRAPVYVQIKTAGGKKRLDDRSFVGNQGRTVFRRVGAKRLPIEPVRTIDVPQMFNQKRINKIVRDVMQQDFARILTSEARYYARRLAN
jgi:Prophage minor tail protein Z (GPZ)